MPFSRKKPVDKLPPLPKYNGDTSNWGKHIQRIMEVLETSTETQRNSVRILFYGQSIMARKWHAWVERWLRLKYPTVDFYIENRSLGGYDTLKLVKTIELDVLVSRPDLVIFHAYGNHVAYENIIHTIRQKSSAEVMILSDHWFASTLQEDGSLFINDWSKFYNKYLPTLAQKYRCELVDIKGPWKDYLELYKLSPQDLLIDELHPNDHGRWLMSEFVIRQMVYKPELITETSSNLSKTLTISNDGGDLCWDDQVLEFDFKGSRIDLSYAKIGGSSCEIYIDGKHPSEFPESNVHDRCTALVKPFEWPEIMRIGFEVIPQPQMWTITVTKVDIKKLCINFDIEGSVVGADGSGCSTDDFISDSKQVVISSESWITSFSLKKKEFENGKIKVGMKIRWKSKCLSRDFFFPSVMLEKDRILSTTIANGLKNCRHKIKIIADAVPPPISHVKIYKPIIPEGKFKSKKFNWRKFLES